MDDLRFLLRGAPDEKSIGAITVSMKILNNLQIIEDIRYIGYMETLKRKSLSTCQLGTYSFALLHVALLSTEIVCHHLRRH